MSREEIERLDDQGMAAWDGHDAEGFANLFRRQVRRERCRHARADHDQGRGPPVRPGLVYGLPDMSVKQTNRVVSDEAVAAEVQFTGTNTGPMMMAGRRSPDRQERVGKAPTSPA
jgi:hypothetical protein